VVITGGKTLHGCANGLVWLADLLLILANCRPS